MLSDHLVAALAVLGLPVLFSVILLASVGLPLPASLLLITAGVLVEHGSLDLRAVIGTAAVAVIMGDTIGYGLGRWGNPRLLPCLMQGMGSEARVRQLGASAARWGGIGIFVTRWLVPPLGPAINLTSGIARYPWPSFLAYEAPGALLWVVLYTQLGRRSGDRLQQVGDLLGTMEWTAVVLAVGLLLGWKIRRRNGRRCRGHPR